MSSILKALKKIEDEKSSQGLSVDNKGAAPTVKGKRGSFMLLFAGALIGSLLVVLIFLLSHNSFVVVPKQAAEPRSEQLADNAEAQEPPVFKPVADLPQKKETVAEKTSPSLKDFQPVVQHQKSTLPEPSKKVVRSEKFAPAKDKQLSGDESSTSNVSSEALKNERQVIAKEEGRSLLKETSEQVVPTVIVGSGTVSRPGDLKTEPQLAPKLTFQVTEIFYSQEDGGSMAIVNDLPVMEGTWIDGVLLKEIQPDQVIFEVEGIPTALPLAPADR